MTPSLFLDWQLSRLGRSGTIAIAGCFVLACALVWMAAGNQERRKAIEGITLSTPAAVRTQDAMPLDLPAWRARLSAEEVRLPERRRTTPLVRAAVAGIESSDVAIEALSTTSSKVSGLPYEVVALDTRLAGPASKVARAVSQVLAGSPGWALESLTLERRPAGHVAVEATFVLLTRDAR